MDGKKFLAHVSDTVKQIDEVAIALRQLMIANSLCQDIKQRKMATTLMSMVLDLGTVHISSRLEMRDVDQNDREIEKLYRTALDSEELTEKTVKVYLIALRNSSFKQRRYFEKRDGVKYVGRELNVPVKELLERHIKAIKKVFKERGVIVNIDEFSVLPTL